MTREGGEANSRPGERALRYSEKPVKKAITPNTNKANDRNAEMRKLFGDAGWKQ
jgi:hypothetical protein